jgi:uncharacterized protein
MKFLRLMARIFWNKEEKRLRAFWRLGLHTTVLFVLTSFFTLALLFINVIFDLIGGTRLQNVLAATDPMAIMEAPWIGTVIIPAATFLAVLLTTFMAGKWVDRRQFREFGIVFNKKWWVDFAFGLGLGAFLIGMIFLFGWATGNVRITGYFLPFNEELSFASGFLQSLSLFLFVGVYEEVLSRGYHLINLAEGLNTKFIEKRWALILALLVSSLVFGLLHMGNPNASLISTLNISLAGVFLGLGMVLTGSLAIPIGLHITWNLFQGNVFGFPVSGINTGATIIATESVGQQWLTGGAFGPEAGVLGLAAMVIGSVLTLVWIHRKGRLTLRGALAEYSREDLTG